ncbi:MAG: HAD family hydrolase [Candidatus Uhrbacteria bacterium]
MKYQVILFDFDGVLCHDKFYEKTMLPDYQEAYDWIQKNVFRSSEVVHDWMLGKISHQQINRNIASAIDVDFEELNNLFLESVRLMSLDKELLELIAQLKNQGFKTGIVSDNMDVFSEITVKNHVLNSLFQIIKNSADTRMLKNNDNGKIFDLTLEELGESDYSRAIMIDDSKGTVELFQSKGGCGILYTDLNNLKLELAKIGVLNDQQTPEFV